VPYSCTCERRSSCGPNPTCGADSYVFAHGQCATCSATHWRQPTSNVGAACQRCSDTCAWLDPTVPADSSIVPTASVCGFVDDLFLNATDEPLICFLPRLPVAALLGANVSAAHFLPAFVSTRPLSLVLRDGATTLDLPPLQAGTELLLRFEPARADAGNRTLVLLSTRCAATTPSTSGGLAVAPSECATFRYAWRDFVWSVGVRACGELDGRCLQCPLERFGDMCRGNCSSGCAAVSSSPRRCDRTTGRCFECELTTFGEQCEHRCSDNCVATPVSPRRCDRATGNCFECGPFNYGDTCERVCSSANCAMTATSPRLCDRQLGRCLECQPTKWGAPFCELACSSGCRATRQSSPRPCNATTGACAACAATHFNLGAFCGSACDERCALPFATDATVRALPDGAVSLRACHLVSGACHGVNRRFFSASSAPPPSAAGSLDAVLNDTVALQTLSACHERCGDVLAEDGEFWRAQPGANVDALQRLRSISLASVRLGATRDMNTTYESYVSRYEEAICDAAGDCRLCDADRFGRRCEFDCSFGCVAASSNNSSGVFAPHANVPMLRLVARTLPVQRFPTRASTSGEGRLCVSATMSGAPAGVAPGTCVQVDVCGPLHWGPDCRQPCPDGCAAGDVGGRACDALNGTCVQCKAFRFGRERCDRWCPAHCAFAGGGAALAASWEGWNGLSDGAAVPERRDDSAGHCDIDTGDCALARCEVPVAWSSRDLVALKANPKRASGDGPVSVMLRESYDEDTSTVACGCRANHYFEPAERTCLPCVDDAVVEQVGEMFELCFCVEAKNDRCRCAPDRFANGTLCSRCPELSSQAADNELECRCQLGYQLAGGRFDSAAPACVPCPRGHFCTNGESAEPCPLGSYNGRLGQTQCTACPIGKGAAPCDRLGLESPLAAPGFWFTLPIVGGVGDVSDIVAPLKNGSVVIDFIQCPLVSSCPGGGPDSCAMNRGGIACVRCKERYFDEFGRCVECPAVPATAIVLLIVFILLLLLSSAAKDTLPDFDIIKAIIRNMQLFSTYKLFVVAWPPLLLDMLDVLSFVRINIDLAGPDCFVAWTTVLKARVVLVPAIVAAVIAMVVSIVVMVCNVQSITCRSTVRLVARACWTFYDLIFITMLLHIMSSLKCSQSSSGVYLLDDDPSIVCDFSDPNWASLVWLASSAIAIDCFMALTFIAVVTFRFCLAVEDAGADLFHNMDERTIEDKLGKEHFKKWRGLLDHKSLAVSEEKFRKLDGIYSLGLYFRMYKSNAFHRVRALGCVKCAGNRAQMSWFLFSIVVRVVVTASVLFPTGVLQLTVALAVTALQLVCMFGCCFPFVSRWVNLEEIALLIINVLALTAGLAIETGTLPTESDGVTSFSIAIIVLFALVLVSCTGLLVYRLVGFCCIVREQRKSCMEIFKLLCCSDTIERDVFATMHPIPVDSDALSDVRRQAATAAPAMLQSHAMCDSQDMSAQSLPPPSSFATTSVQGQRQRDPQLWNDIELADAPVHRSSQLLVKPTPTVLITAAPSTAQDERSNQLLLHQQPQKEEFYTPAAARSSSALPSHVPSPRPSEQSLPPPFELRTSFHSAYDSE
jgi:hypothetical protein